MASSIPNRWTTIAVATAVAAIAVPGRAQHGGIARLTVVSVPAQNGAEAERSPPARPPMSARERKIRSLFLCHFCSYVTWPESAFARPGAPIVIGIVGEDPLGKILDETVRDRRVKGRPLAARRFGAFAELRDPRSLAGCHLLVIAETDPIVVGKVIGALADDPVLLVSCRDGFAAAGGGVQLFVQDNHVRFEINREVLVRAGLQPSSDLMRMSRPAPAAGGHREDARGHSERSGR